MNQYESRKDILRELRQQRDQNSDLYIKVPIQPARTLLLMGSTRAGKSTIYRTLLDSLAEPEISTLYSTTRTPLSQQIGGLRIIDMPGFNDLQMQSGNIRLNNNSILTMLQKQLNDYDPIHLVAYVFNLHDGIKQEDIDAMLFVQSNLPYLAGRMMLVVTHAEELNDEEKNKLTEEFFDHPNVKRYHLRDFFDEEILFVGCIRYESLKQLDYSAVANEHQNVLQMRKKFIEKCFEDVPLTKQKHQQPNKRYSSLLSNAPVLLLLIFIIYIFYGSVDLLGTINNSTNISDLSHNLTTEYNMTFNETALDEKDAGKEEVQTIDYDNIENQESLSNPSIESPSDDAFDNLVLNSTPDTTLLKTVQTTNELLFEILMEMKDNNHVSKMQSDAIAKISHRLDNIENTLKRNHKS
jgi:GTP-binding protein EngB required for normal cell division